MIDPNAVSTIRIGELSPEPFSLTDNVPHEVGTELKRGTIEDLATFISAFIGSTDGVGFRAISVTDGQTLPTTTQQEFILVGKGTYYNVVGGSTIICTEELNAIVSNGSYWFIGVEIPINVELAGITQFIRDGFINTTPSEDTVHEALALKSNVADSENIANKQNDLTPDGSNTKYPTVTAVNTGLATKAPLASPSLTGTPTAPTATVGTNTTQIATTAFVTNGIATADSQNVKLTGNQTISGQKSFSLTGKIDMQTDNAFPAIRVTTLGSNGGSAAVFLNDSSFPNSKALRLQTSSSGGVGNMALDVSNQSPIGTGILSNASNGGVSISSQSGDGDSYVSNITYGGTGRNYVGRNNGIETYSVDKTGSVTATQYKISALNTAPASATATGTLGEIRITAGFIYVCTATNTWVRTALATW